MSTNIIPCMYVPITIASGTNDKIYFRRAVAAPLTGTIASGYYRSPHVLIASATLAMNAATGFTNFTGSFNTTTGKVNWTWLNLSFQMLTPLAQPGGDSKASAHELLGWRSGSQDPATHVSPASSSNQIANYWSPDINVAKDSFDVKSTVGEQSVTLDGHHQNYVIGTSTTRDLSFNFVPVYKIIQSQTGSLYFSQSFEEIWDGAKQAVNYWPDRTAQTTFGQYFVIKPEDDIKPKRNRFASPALFDFDIKLGKLGG